MQGDSLKIGFPILVKLKDRKFTPPPAPTSLEDKGLLVLVFKRDK